MLAFFRRALGSWVVLGLLGLVLVAFLVTGVSAPKLAGLGGASDPDVVAMVGDQRLTGADVARRIQGQLNEAKRQQPEATMAQLLAAAGGITAIVDQMATAKSIEVWASQHGLVASDRLVDAQIATIPAFFGPTGVFDERTMSAVLSQQRVTLADLRSGIRGDLLRRQLLVPMTAGIAVPQSLVKSYAALMVARRFGDVAAVPINPAAVPAPSAADVAAWYKARIGTYSLPERRVIRYAPLDETTVTIPAPTDAEIAAQYKTDSAKYAAAESRTLSQVVLPDEAKAKAFAAKVAGGTPFATAAKDAGFAATDITLGKLTKPVFATASSAAAADQVFAAANGATVGPIKSALGFQIVHVDGIEKSAGKTLDQAKPEIVTALTAKKKTEALSTLAQKLEDAISGGSTFDEVTKANKLTVVSTPPVTASGAAPSDANFKADPTVMGLLKPAFMASPDDQATVETVSPDHYALLSLASVVPGAPIPLDQVRPRVTADIVADRANAAARAAAKAIVDKVEKGAPFAATLAAAGLKPAQPVATSQLEAAQAGQQVPPPLRALFLLAPGHAVIVPGNGAWFVVRLDHVADGDPKFVDPIGARLKPELSQNLGSELIEQFARAARNEIKVQRNPSAISALQRQLLGQAPAGQ